VFSVGAAARPAEVSKPAALSSIHRLRLMSDHLLVGRRGVTLTAYRSSSSRLMRLSIHPKHNASRAASSYGIDFSRVWRLWNTSQIPGLDVWCVASHARH